jgi:hypothetical protein
MSEAGQRGGQAARDDEICGLFSMMVKPWALELELTDEHDDINDPDKPLLELQIKNHQNKITPAVQHSTTFNQRHALGSFMQNTCMTRLPLVILDNCIIMMRLTFFQMTSDVT